MAHVMLLDADPAVEAEADPASPQHGRDGGCSSLLQDAGMETSLGKHFLVVNIFAALCNFLTTKAEMGIFS